MNREEHMAKKTNNYPEWMALRISTRQRRNLERAARRESVSTARIIRRLIDRLEAEPCTR
jgi:hypothetical protein